MLDMRRQFHAPSDDDVIDQCTAIYDRLED
jgi:hypothetical protein